MSEITNELAAKMLGRFLISPRGRELLADCDGERAPIIACTEHDLVSDVLYRARTYAAPVMAFVAYANGGAAVVSFHTASDEALSGDRGSVDPKSTMGMLCDYVNQAGSFVFRLTPWDSVLEADRLVDA